MTRGYLSEDARPKRDNSVVTLSGCVCIAASVKAIRVRIGEGESAVLAWVPQSVVHDDSEVYAPGHTGKLVVPAWWLCLQPWGKDFCE